MTKILLYGISKIYGGIESIIYNLCKNMDESFVFDVLCDYDTCAYYDFFQSRGGKLFSVTKRGDNPIRHSADVKNFFKKNKEYDYVWVNTASSSSIYVQKYAKKYTNAKIITHSHGVRIEGSGINYKINMFLHKLHHKKMLELSDFKFACSLLAGEYLFGENVRFKVINNGIDTFANRFNIEERIKQREAFGLDNEVLAIGIVGRLTPVKNHRKAFDVFKNVVKSEDSKLFVIGDGEMREELEALAHNEGLNDNIIFTGYRTDVNLIINAMDVIIMPSFHEGFPVVSVEAQCNGLECFFSDNITKEILITDQAHFLDINADSEYWAKEIIQNRVSKNDRENAYLKVKEKGYDIKDIVLELAEFLRENS